MKLLVDNRSDSTKMHGATIRFIESILFAQEEGRLRITEKIKYYMSVINTALYLYTMIYKYINKLLC